MSKDDDKLVNAIISLHQEIKGLRKDMEKQQAKTNAGLGELRLSYMKLDERVKDARIDLNKLFNGLDRLDYSLNKLDVSFNKYAEITIGITKKHEKRLVRLEDNTFGGSFVAEPRTAYKKVKRKK